MGMTEIMEFILAEYIDPARGKGHKEITIRAGDIYIKMEKVSRIPDVCSALKSKKLQKMCGLEIKDIKRPAKGDGAFLSVTFEILPVESYSRQGFKDTINHLKKNWIKTIKPLEAVIWKKFRSYLKRAEYHLNNADKIEQLLTDVLSFIAKDNKVLKSVFKEVPTLLKDIPTLIQLVKSRVDGNYKDVPVKTIIYIIAALIYLVNPFDVIPDPIPVIGYLDDIVVIMFVIKSFREDIESFRQWEINNK